MGKRKHQKKERSAKGGFQRKKRKSNKYPQEKLWIEDFVALRPKKGQLVGAMTVVVTRIQLNDDYRHAKVVKVRELSSPHDSDNGNNGKNEIREVRDQVSEPNDCSDQNSTKQSHLPVLETKDVSSGSINLRKEVNVEQAIVSDSCRKDGASEAIVSLPGDRQEGVGKIASEVSCSFAGSFIVKMDDETSIPPPSTQPSAGKKDHTEPSESEKKPDKRQPFVTIVRAPSAKGKIKIDSKNNFVELPNGDCGDGVLNPHPKDEVADKYWAQRRRLFSRFDEGVQLDKESWYSVTPEAIANHIANRIVKMTSSSDKSQECLESLEKGGVVLDVFCGCGGNAIAFARVANADISLVVCVDVDRSKLRMAAHNARIYGIDPAKLLFIEGEASFVMERCYRHGQLVYSKEAAPAPSDTEDCEGYKIGGIDHLPERIDAIFLSPPWGGVDYGKAGRRGYDLATCVKVHRRVEYGNETKSSFRQGDEKAIVSNEKPSPTSDLAQATRTDDTVNGEQLLTMAASAARDKLVVYFLPRNMNGVSLGRAALKAGYRGTTLELEQNVLNGKLKTITAYLGPDCSVSSPPASGDVTCQ